MVITRNPINEVRVLIAISQHHLERDLFKVLASSVVIVMIQL